MNKLKINEKKLKRLTKETQKSITEYNKADVNIAVKTRWKQ